MDPGSSFTHLDGLPYQYTYGELRGRLGSYQSRPIEIRRGDCDGELLSRNYVT